MNNVKHGLDDIKKYFSVSQINTYMRCPFQWYFRYVEGLVKPPDFGLIVGSATHKAIETNFKQKITSKIDAPMELLESAFSDEFDKKKLDVPDRNDEGQQKDMGIKLVRMHRSKLAPRIQPTHVEHEFLIDVPKQEINIESKSVIIDIPWKFKGYIDLIDADKVVVDNKTTGKSYQEDAADENYQLMGYGFAHKQIFGELPSGVRFDILVKTKVPKFQQIRSTIDENKINRFLLAASNVYKAINAGIFYPRRGQDCSWCGYKENCKNKKIW